MGEVNRLMARRPAAAPTELARTPSFRLGALAVTPSLRQVARGGAVEVLEPRVMQVLVVLAGAKGQPVSRDELIDTCWGGRIVVNNAVNRTIYQLRRLSEGIGGGAFRIETIPKVGYRLLEGTATDGDTPAGAWPLSGPALSRRRFGRALLWVGGSVAGAGLAAALWVRQSRRGRAQSLYRAGLGYLRFGDAGASDQAAVYFRQAVAADPAFAEAWTALARTELKLGLEKQGPSPEPEFGQARAAARRALELDPQSPEAAAVAVAANVIYGRWAEVERLARRLLAAHPGQSAAQETLCRVLAQAGRWREAAGLARALVEREPYDARHQRLLAQTLWCTGEPDLARATLAWAARRWPDDKLTWLARFNLLAQGGWPNEALALVDDRFVNEALPIPLELAGRCARALAEPTATRSRATIAAIRDARRQGRIASPVALVYLTLLGDVDEAFAQAYGYYLVTGEGGTAGQRRPAHGERLTDVLFTPATARLRAHPRFPALMEAIGLAAYWRETGQPPDEGVSRPRRPPSP